VGGAAVLAGRDGADVDAAERRDAPAAARPAPCSGYALRRAALPCDILASNWSGNLTFFAKPDADPDDRTDPFGAHFENAASWCNAAAEHLAVVKALTAPDPGDARAALHRHWRRWHDRFAVNRPHDSGPTKP
jgi:hypothetical protein